jgi:ABC-2 type transport system permease protein
MHNYGRAIWVTAYREFLRYVNNRSRLASSFLMPILLLVIFGAGFNKSLGNLVPGVDFIKYMYPGIIAMSVFQTSLFAGLSIVWDREIGFLREVLVAPLPRSGIILGKAAGNAVTAVIQGMVMLILAPFVHVSLSPITVLELIPILIIISLAISGIGLLVGSRLRSQQSFQMVIGVLLLPLMFASGAFFPLNTVPLWLLDIARINPLTYGVDAMRHVFLGNPAASALGIKLFGHLLSTGEDMLLVFILGVVLITLTAVLFSRQD